MQGITRREFMKMTGIVSSSIALGIFAENNLFNIANAASMFNIQGPFSTQTLSNKVQMPILGFGTSGVRGEKGKEAILTAIQSGYRMIDTASIYNTEREVGEAVMRSGIPRDEIFITTKLWNDKGSAEEVLESFNESLVALKMDYVDLYLIHFPAPNQFKDRWLQRDIEVWEAMEQLYKDGRIKAIGISNFYPEHLHAFLPECKIKPMVNQIEIHPFYVEDRLIELCRHHKIVIQAYSPLAKGKEAFKDKILQKVATKHDKSVAQVMLRWSLQKGFIPLPRSTNADRIKENINIFDFALDSRDMSAINRLKSAKRKIIPIS